MRAESWFICPMLFVPASLLWACLYALCEHFSISDRLSKRFGIKKKTIDKWQTGILVAVSLFITAFILLAISDQIGFDLINWEKIEKV